MDEKNDLTKQQVRFLWKKIDRKVKGISTDTEIGGMPNELLQSLDQLPITLSGIDDKINALGGLNAQEIMAQLSTLRENTGQRKIRYNRLKDALDSPEIAGILNIYADEVVTEDADGEILHIIHPDEDIRVIVEDLFTRLGVYDKSWSVVRNMCAFGDEFYEVIVSKDTRRILKMVQIPREILKRLERNGDLIGFQFIEEEIYNTAMDPNNNGMYIKAVNYNTTAEKEDQMIYPFRILHFKIPSSKYGVYGEAVIDCVLGSIEQLSMMEKALLIARITRAPERRIFNINVGTLTGEQAVKYVRMVMDNFRNRKRLDVYTKKQIDYQKDIWGATEDIAIPKRAGEEGNSIDTLDQLNGDNVADLEFIRDKIFPGVGIPRQYLFDDSFANANTNLSSKSVPFSKRIRRIQRYFLYQLYKLAFVELKLQGFKNEKINELIILMNNPSNIDEKERIEIETSRWNLITAMKSLNAEAVFVPDYWIYKNTLKLSDDEVVEWMKLSQLQTQGKNIFMALPEEDRPEGSEELQFAPPPPAEGEIPAGGAPPAPGAEGETPAGAEGETPAIPTDVVGKLGPAPEVADVQPESNQSSQLYLEAMKKKQYFLEKITKKNIVTIIEEKEKIRELKKIMKSKIAYEELLFHGDLKGLDGEFKTSPSNKTYEG